MIAGRLLALASLTLGIALGAAESADEALARYRAAVVQAEEILDQTSASWGALCADERVLQARAYQAGFAADAGAIDEPAVAERELREAGAEDVAATVRAAYDRLVALRPALTAARGQQLDDAATLAATVRLLERGHAEAIGELDAARAGRDRVAGGGDALRQRRIAYVDDLLRRAQAAVEGLAAQEIAGRAALAALAGGDDSRGMRIGEEVEVLDQRARVAEDALHRRVLAGSGPGGPVTVIACGRDAGWVTPLHAAGDSSGEPDRPLQAGDALAPGDAVSLAPGNDMLLQWGDGTLVHLGPLSRFSLGTVDDRFQLRLDPDTEARVTGVLAVASSGEGRWMMSGDNIISYGYVLLSPGGRCTHATDEVVDEPLIARDGFVSLEFHDSAPTRFEATQWRHVLAALDGR